MSWGRALALILALFLVLGGAARWMWQQGYNAHKAEIDKAIEDGKGVNDKIKDGDKERERETVTEYLEIEKIIYRDGKTIIQKVPVYVPVEADRACTVPLGFVSMHDTAIRAANLGEKAAPGGADQASAGAADAVPAPDWIKLSAGVPLSQVAAVNAQNATYYRELKSRFEKLAQWSSTQCYGPP